MPLQITKADVSHAAIIATIGKKSFRHSFEHLFKCRDELFEYLNHTYDPIKLARSLRKENNIYFIAWRDGEALGFAKVKKHSLHDLIESGAQMELQKLYVLPEHQRKGAGSALLLEVKNLAREICPDYIWLDAHITNENAIRLYQNIGFEKIGKHHFTIGTQTFEYHVMGLPVALNIKTAC